MSRDFMNWLQTEGLAKLTSVMRLMSRIPVPRIVSDARQGLLSLKYGSRGHSRLHDACAFSV
jgi:hypothetical protein